MFTRQTSHVTRHTRIHTSQVVDIIACSSSKDAGTNFALCCLACVVFKDLSNWDYFTLQVREPLMLQP